MPSSISNSDSHTERRVWKILVVAALIVAAYQAIVPRVVPDGGRGHDQWQENLIKAQRIVYGHVSPAAIVVGSSKMARISFAPASHIYNLALNGDGSLTGLEVIRRAGARPRIVVVEVGDVIVREADAGFLESVFGAVNHRLRGWIPVLQDAYQPGVLINHAAQTWAERRARLQDDHVPPELYRQLLATQTTNHAAPPDFVELARVLRALRGAIDALHAAHITVVFVEPPEDPALWQLPASAAIRHALRQTFADVPWFPTVDLSTYQTTDAVHLDRDSAERFGAALATWLATVPTAP